MEDCVKRGFQPRIEPGANRAPADDGNGLFLLTWFRNEAGGLTRGVDLA